MSSARRVGGGRGVGCLLAWIAVAGVSLAGATTVTPAALAQTDRAEPRTNLADVSDEVMCLVCGVPLDHALENPQAQREREFIRGMIAEGSTKDEIKSALVAEYGENVLATPGNDGFDLAAWMVPGAAFVTAAFAIGIGLRRWRRQGGSAEPPAAADEPALDPDDAKRLDADIARYEL